MRTWRILALLGLVVAVAGLALAGDEGSSSRNRGKVQIIQIDEDGNRDEKVWVFDDDGGYLGVHLDGEPGGRGARIVGVVDDSPAAEAGLEEDDVIIAMDGEEIRGPMALARGVRSLRPGDEVELEVERDGRTWTITVELGERSGHHSFSFGDMDDLHFDLDLDALEDLEFDLDMDELHDHLEELREHLDDMEFDFDLPEFNFRFGGHSRPRLGVQIIQPTEELRSHLGGPDDAGILVGKVLEDTPAEDAGLQVGDLIVAVDDREIRDAGDLIGALEHAGGGEIVLEVVRDGRTLMLDAVLPEEEERDEPRYRRETRPMRQPVRHSSPTQRA
jgi:S1-C subfamily serine protease